MSHQKHVQYNKSQFGKKSLTSKILNKLNQTTDLSDKQVEELKNTMFTEVNMAEIMNKHSQSLDK